MKYQKLIYGYDSILTNSVCEVKSVSVQSIANESLSSEVPTNAQNANQFFLQGLTAETAKALRDGMAYLVFEIEAINHITPTKNRRIYPKDEFKAGMQEYGFQNQLRLGGVPGEAEHPLLQMATDNDQKNMFNNMMRIEKVEPSNRSHYVIAWRQDEEKTYFTIKTSVDNPIIVNDLMNGMLPAFSIRTRCQFVPDMENQCEVAKDIHIIGIDYVRNPSNAGSTPLTGKISFVDPIHFKTIDMNIMQTNSLVPSMGMESENTILSLLGEDDLIAVDPGLEGVNQLQRFAILKPVPDKEKEFNQLMKHAKHFL